MTEVQKEGRKEGRKEEGKKEGGRKEGGKKGVVDVSRKEVREERRDDAR